MKIMGLFWLLAEGLIMIFVRKGVLFLETGEARQKRFLFFCIAVFAFIVILSLDKNILLNRIPGLPNNFLGGFFYGYLWNFQCVLWIIIEGVVAVNVFKGYQLLKNALNKQAYQPPATLRYGPIIFYLIILTGYVFYHFYLYTLTGQHRIPLNAVGNILTFYIKICGIFWILIEGVIAVIAVKAFILLRRRLS